MGEVEELGTAKALSLRGTTVIVFHSFLTLLLIPHLL